MNKKDEALRLAIEALEDASSMIGDGASSIPDYFINQINACKEALAESQLSSNPLQLNEQISQESIASMQPIVLQFEYDQLTEEFVATLDDKTGMYIYGGNRGKWAQYFNCKQKLYTHPLKRLEDDEVDEIFNLYSDKQGYVSIDDWSLIANAIQNKLGVK